MRAVTAGLATSLTALFLAACGAADQPAHTLPPQAKTPSEAEAPAAGYTFRGGFPEEDSVRKAYEDADLTRAVQAYRFFYPTVSGAAIFKGNAKVGVVPNQAFGTLDTRPRHVGFTLNSDTPYAPILLDLHDGPMVVVLPAGPLIVVAMDINQRWVADMGLPGPDAGKGGKHLLLPPDFKGSIPAGYHVARSTSYRMLVGARSLPVGGDVQAAVDRLRTIVVRPLKPKAGWTAPTWADLTPMPQDTTPLAWETSLQYWQELKEVIETEPPFPLYHTYYGDLAVLGIARGKPFTPNDRMKGILEQAAKLGNAQMRAESFADRRPDRVVWPDRKWEWAALRFENGDFETEGYTDLVARDKWFFQAIGASPAMVRRSAGAGSVYWLGLRDERGDYLDGGSTYKLSVPQPVPCKLFWSVTVYDAETRSQVQTDQGKAALRSLFELKDQTGATPMDLYFGPEAPSGKQGQWIKTIPGKGWFVYLRVYGPEASAFDGTWIPGDFKKVE
jgi:hypothetical protein